MLALRITLLVIDSKIHFKTSRRYSDTMFWCGRLVTDGVTNYLIWKDRQIYNLWSWEWHKCKKYLSGGGVWAKNLKKMSSLSNLKVILDANDLKSIIEHFF